MRKTTGYLVMNNLLDISDQQASSATVDTTTNTADSDEKVLQQFMIKNPVWTSSVFQKMTTYAKLRLRKNNLQLVIITR